MREAREVRGGADGGWDDLFPSLLRPLVVAAMVGCVAYSLARLLRLFRPEWSVLLPVGVGVTGALLGYGAHGLLHRRVSSGIERGQFQLLALVIAFLVLKVAGYAGVPLSVVAADVQGWFLHPLTFFDPGTVASFCLFAITWSAAWATAADFERVGEVSYDRHERPPLETVSRRFYVGGALLLLVTGYTRVGLGAILDLNRPSVPGLLLNVLLYFLLGLSLIGQIRFRALLKGWRARGIPVAEELAARWLRYGLAFLVVTTLVAFVLPTGYTLPLLDLGSWLLWLLWVVAAFLVFLVHLLLLPVVWPISIIMGRTVESPQLDLTPPPTSLAGEVDPAGGPSWFQLARSFLFWGLVIVLLVYVVRAYLRDHPELAHALGRWRPARTLVDLARALWGWLRGLWSTVQENLPRRRARPEVRGEEARRGFLRRLRPTGSARERVLDYYLTVVDRAAEEGLRRRGSETPREYAGVLDDRLTDEREAIRGLTSAFVKARYSAHPMRLEDVEGARRHGEAVRRALEQLHRARERGSG
jgi:hypothetical protein